MVRLIKSGVPIEAKTTNDGMTALNIAERAGKEGNNILTSGLPAMIQGGNALQALARRRHQRVGHTAHCWNSSCLAVTWPLRGLRLPIILYAGAYSIGCCLLQDRGYMRDYSPTEFRNN